MKYTYYSTQRPVSPGSYPKGNANCEIENFDSKTFIPEIGREAWGKIIYSEPLPEKQVEDYELIPHPHVNLTRDHDNSSNFLLRIPISCGPGNVFSDLWTQTEDLPVQNFSFLGKDGRIFEAVVKDVCYDFFNDVVRIEGYTESDIQNNFPNLSVKDLSLNMPDCSLLPRNIYRPASLSLGDSLPETKTIIEDVPVKISTPNIDNVLVGLNGFLEHGIPVVDSLEAPSGLLYVSTYWDEDEGYVNKGTWKTRIEDKDQKTLKEIPYHSITEAARGHVSVISEIQQTLEQANEPKKVLWFSRHEMTPEQKKALGTNIEIHQINRSIDSAYEIQDEIDNADIVAIVAPIQLQQQFLKIAGPEKPVIMAVNDRALIPGPDGTENKMEFQFKKWEQLVRIEVEKKDFEPEKYADYVFPDASQEQKTMSVLDSLIQEAKDSLIQEETREHTSNPSHSGPECIR